jgi:hypothetical protein
VDLAQAFALHGYGQMVKHHAADDDMKILIREWDFIDGCGLETNAQIGLPIRFFFSAHRQSAQ